MLPLLGDYEFSVKKIDKALKDRPQMQPVLQADGSPVFASAGFACVYKVQENGQTYALKCFIRDVADRREHYRQICHFLGKQRSAYLIAPEYLSESLYVRSSAAGNGWYDVVLMPWVEGQTLGDYAAQACQRTDRKALQQLAHRFGQLGAWLLEQEFAHGDLKHDNLMVRPDGSLLLIDYDGMFVPALQGRPALEMGGQGYQHPARAAHHFDRHLDDFSILIITLSLHALAAAPELYHEKGTDNLLLAQKDLQNLQASPTLARLFALNHPEVNRLLMLLYQSLAAQSLHIPHLPELLPKGEVLQAAATAAIKPAPAYPPTPDLIPYRRGDKWGFCTPDKRVVIPCEYDDAWPFKEGQARVRTGDYLYGKYGFVNTQGQLVVPCEYDEAGYFSEGLAGVRKDWKDGFVNAQGQLVVPCEYDDTRCFSEGLAMVRIGDYKNGKWGFVNTQGQLVVPCEYDGAEDFREGLSKVNIGGTKDFYEQLSGGKWGFVNFQGQFIVPCEYDDAGNFSEGLAGVRKNGKWGFVNMQGQLVLPFEYDGAYIFREGLAMVEKNGKWGFINVQGQLVVPCEYDDARDFCEGLAWVNIGAMYEKNEDFDEYYLVSTPYKLVYIILLT